MKQIACVVWLFALTTVCGVLSATPAAAQTSTGIRAGGGPSLIIADSNDHTDVGGGFNLLFGVEHESGLFVEAKAGFVDSPDFKLGVGYSFR